MGNLCTYIQFSYEPKSVLRKLNIKKNLSTNLGLKVKNLSKYSETYQSLSISNWYTKYKKVLKPKWNHDNGVHDA